MAIISARTLRSNRKKTTAADRKLAAFQRKIKRAVVDAGVRGWLTPQQTRFALNRLGLRHE